MRFTTIIIAAMLIAIAPAHAGNSLIPPNARTAVAKSALTVTPGNEWNKLGARPGRNSETWTLDGDLLNDVTFYGGIPSGKTLFREISKKHKPLPRVSSTMLITDIPVLLENSYRIALDTPLMAIDAIEPAEFLGTKGIRFTYSFALPNEELRRCGEARAAMVKGKLYMITYEAPALHYFDTSVSAFRQLADSATLAAVQ
jgi:hypothetical protein